VAATADAAEILQDLDQIVNSQMPGPNAAARAAMSKKVQESGLAVLTGVHGPDGAVLSPFVYQWALSLNYGPLFDASTAGVHVEPGTIPGNPLLGPGPSGFDGGWVEFAPFYLPTLPSGR